MATRRPSRPRRIRFDIRFPTVESSTPTRPVSFVTPEPFTPVVSQFLAENISWRFRRPIKEAASLIIRCSKFLEPARMAHYRTHGRRRPRHIFCRISRSRAISMSAPLTMREISLWSKFRPNIRRGKQEPAPRIIGLQSCSASCSSRSFCSRGFS